MAWEGKLAFYDLPLEQLRTYRPERVEPQDFDEFWENTLAEVRRRPLEPKFEQVEVGLRTVDVYDVTFNGYGGQPIKGWLLMPRQRPARLPCVVEYIGYGGGRGFPIEWLVWASAGYAHLVMDTRGQGSSWRTGDTPDIEPEGSNPQYPGFLTRGVLKPETYYYRRLISDAVRAVETAQSAPGVEPTQIALTGHSQGGGLTLAVSGLLPEIPAAMPDVPFLCHYRRATEITDSEPYHELAAYCAAHRDQVERVFQTLSYFDGLNFAPRARARALFSTALMDDICPPSTVFAAYNYYAGPESIEVWPYNQHDGGGQFQILKQIEFLADIWGSR